MTSVSFERRDIPTILLPIPTVECVATYQWKDNTLVIPGVPNELREPLPPGKELPTLKPDGVQFIDENHYRYPTMPLLPGLYALEIIDPNFDLGKIDFITDRSNLRKLIQFIHASGDKDFDIHLDTAPQIGHCCCMTRVEKVDRGENNGFGFDFESHMMKRDRCYLRRLVRMKLGRINLLVCSEIDALENEDESSACVTHATDIPRKWEMPGRPNLQCESGGDANYNLTALPVKFKTKNERYKYDFDWNLVGMQMIFGGIRKLVVGWMKGRGVVSNIEQFDINQVQERMSETEETLGKLEHLLRNIQKVALKSGGSFRLFCFSCGPLRMKSTATRMLSEKY